jgi:hypothetical protein
VSLRCLARGGDDVGEHHRRQHTVEVRLLGPDDVDELCHVCDEFGCIAEVRLLVDATDGFEAGARNQLPDVVDLVARDVRVVRPIQQQRRDVDQRARWTRSDVRA